MKQFLSMVRYVVRSDDVIVTTVLLFLFKECICAAAIYRTNDGNHYSVKIGDVHRNQDIGRNFLRDVVWNRGVEKNVNLSKHGQPHHNRQLQNK